MSTTTETGATPQQPPVPGEQEDPWRYGWRYVRRQNPDGTEYREQVPLGPRDILFPQEEDFIVHTDGHNEDCRYLKTALKAWAVGRDGVLVLCDHRVDWQVEGIEPLGPDVVVFDGIHDEWDPNRGTFPVKSFGARTLLVIEVTSPDSRANDLGIKVDFYRRFGVLFYAIVDRRQSRRGPELRLFAYRPDPASRGQYAEVQPDERGRIWLDTARLWLGLENDRAVLYDAEGARVPDYDEIWRMKQAAAAAHHAAEARAATEEAARRDSDARAAAADARAKELEAELQRLRAQSQGGPPNPAAP